jgi:hypothetical protein
MVMSIMKRISIMIATLLLMISSTAFAKHYVIVDDGFGPVLMKTHRAHSFADPGFYYVERQPKIRPVYYDRWGRPFVVSRKHFVISF